MMGRETQHSFTPVLHISSEVVSWGKSGPILLLRSIAIVADCNDRPGGCDFPKTT